MDIVAAGEAFVPEVLVLVKRVEVGGYPCGTYLPPRREIFVCALFKLRVPGWVCGRTGVRGYCKQRGGISCSTASQMWGS